MEGGAAVAHALYEAHATIRPDSNKHAVSGAQASELVVSITTWDSSGRTSCGHRFQSVRCLKALSYMMLSRERESR